MQYWEKIGLVHENNLPGYTHATLPVALPYNKESVRIYFSSRDAGNRSLPLALTLNMRTFDTSEIETHPLFPTGRPGEFDADGVMPTCVVRRGTKIYLFYIGWNRGVDVPFRNAIGVAVSDDNGKTFVKPFEGPLLDRSIHDPCFVASCDILEVKGRYSMWYLSGLRWERQADGWKHFYHIKSASSTDLLNWARSGDVAIDFKNSFEYAISTPRVLKRSSSLYCMWYSYRGSPREATYRIGYAESADGLSWTRKDEQVQLDPGESGWDSEMVCYPFVFEWDNNLYMLYNGNQYGRSGFGIATLINDSNRF